MTHSIIKKSQLEGALRLDAEYFQPEYLEVEKQLDSIKTLKIADISNSVVNFGAYSLCNFIEWQKEGVPYINVGDVKDGYVDFSNIKHIDENVNEILKKSVVKNGEVILTMAGSIGNVAIAHNFPDKVNSNQATAKISLKKRYSPYFLTAFLLSEFGQKQIKREIVSSVQPNIFLFQIKNFLVPNIQLKKQRDIENIFIEYLDELENSKKFYQQAEELLLEELGLVDFEDENDLVSIVKLSEVKNANRIDAEYFQVKYKKLIEKIKKQNAKKLDELIKNYSTGYPFKSENYQENGIPLIRINNIKKDGVDLSDATYLSEQDHKLSTKDTAIAGDIVLSMSGSIGLTAKIPDDIPKCSINQRILKFTPKNIETDFLVLTLNSIVGKLQLEGIGTGGVQTNISYKDIKNILIPILPKSTQQKISELVRKSHTAQQKSKELLEEAKNMVEELIEKSQ